MTTNERDFIGPAYLIEAATVEVNTAAATGGLVAAATVATEKGIEATVADFAAPPVAAPEDRLREDNVDDPAGNAAKLEAMLGYLMAGGDGTGEASPDPMAAAALTEKLTLDIGATAADAALKLLAGPDTAA
jgi:hypothetical protein